MEYKILIADDESDLRDMIRYNLELEGYQVVTASDGTEAIEVAKNERPHLIVLDIRMPGLSGLEACRKIRQTDSISGTPIIMLTALGQERDEVTGFEAGADDYVQKPVSPKVLLTRIEARLRRAYPPAKKSLIAIHDLEIDRERYVVRKIKGEKTLKIHLPRKQFELLFTLADRPGIVLTREELLVRIWGEDVYVTPRTVDVHVRKIRDSIGDDYIETVKGVGYRFKELDDSSDDA
jgi:two-component system alkaline phosphatase synthesis response regulator PhoP